MAIGRISGQGRQLRFAMSAFQRQMAFRYHASVLYRWRYSGAIPERLLIAPIDLRTADPTAALDIYSGRFVFSGTGVDAAGHPIFSADPPSEEWARELHSFGWLRHLRATDMAISRSNARSLVDEWMRASGNTDAVAWEYSYLHFSFRVGLMQGGAQRQPKGQRIWRFQISWPWL